MAAAGFGLPSQAALIADAAAIGRRLGLTIDEPVVLKDSLNLLVWLRPSPVVARIQFRTGLVRDAASVADSLALARFLADRGHPVSPPADGVDPGPHIGPTGRAMTFWRLLDVLDRSPEPRAAGQSLRVLHDTAGAYDGPLRHVGPVEEIGRLAEVLRPQLPGDASRLLELRDRLDLPNLPVQPLHGDAHLGNVVLTLAGPCWVDWEESWRGPIAWDLACLDHRRATFGETAAETQQAFAGYGPYDAAAIAAWLPAVALWAGAWGLVGEVEGLDWQPNARIRLDWVERRLGG